MLINVGMNALGVQTGLAKISGTIGGWANRQASSLQSKFAAAFGATALLEASRRAIKYSDDLVTMSERLQVSTDSLQEFGAAAKVNNAEMADFQSAIEKINASRLKALQDPDSEEAKAFRGLNAGSLRDQRGDDILKTIGQTFKNGGDVEKLMPLLKQVAGRGAGAIIPSLVNGLDVAAESARRLGIIVDSRAINSLASLSDQMDIVGMMLRANFIPVLAFVIEKMMDLYFKLLKDHPVARVARWAGAIAGGARTATEVSAVDKEVGEDYGTFVARMKAELDEATKRRDEILKKIREGTFDDVPEEEKKKRKKGGGDSMGNAFMVRTENQRVGAFINPIAFAVEKEQVAVLKKIENNTRPNRVGARDEDIYANT